MKKMLWMACAVGTSMCLAEESPWRLWYQKPASSWDEALPVGNGQMGAMVFGGVPECRIQFNEHTVWTGFPRSYAHTNAVAALSAIRKLLFDGKQKEAEDLAMRNFMGDPLRQEKYQPCGDLLLRVPVRQLKGKVLLVFLHHIGGGNISLGQLRRPLRDKFISRHDTYPPITL